MISQLHFNNHGKDCKLPKWPVITNLPSLSQDLILIYKRIGTVLKCFTNCIIIALERRSQIFKKIIAQNITQLRFSFLLVSLFCMFEQSVYKLCKVDLSVYKTAKLLIFFLGLNAFLYHHFMLNMKYKDQSFFNS